METASRISRQRVRAHVEGVVQGVGFRPHAYRLAVALGLGGFIRNDTRGVLVEAEGPPERLNEFLARLRSEAPPMARVDVVRTEEIEARAESGFAIAVSEGSGRPEAEITPDVATCRDCLTEIFDPADRRYRYPFTNCTNCGPRFTIVTGVPYDRPQTTMAGFEMCGACRAEYEDPRDRRFHAQPNACPRCGPRLRLLDDHGVEIAADPDAIAATADALRAGLIVAIKGIGGYHLACRADDERAVATLRTRKHREERPFALMAADLEAAAELIELTDAERRLLEGPERPIVLARRRARARVAPSVAPGRPDLGVMLPYSPLHHLLLTEAGITLVMTSGNAADEPIAFEDSDALERLAGIADRFCVHDRPIHVRTDDSVVRSLDSRLREGPLLIRRSRGWVPGALPLPRAAERPILACGAELKSTFCLARGRRAWVSHYIGDLKSFEALDSYTTGVDHLERLLAIDPEIVVHDLHPDYLSTGYALERRGVEHLAVQHHHAHLAACLAEHGQEGTAVGAIYDGAGHGPDGTVWGGELLLGGTGSFRRAGLLFPVRLPGGDAAAREPWRMGLSWLASALDEEEPEPTPQLASLVDPARWSAVAGIVRTGLSSPLTSGVGRLFDAVAALCGLRANATYEGQAASELESIARSGRVEPYPLPILDEPPSPLLLDARPTIRAVRADLIGGAEAGVVSARFHAALATATAAALTRIASRQGTETIVLAGGVFQNRLLLELTAAALREQGLRALMPLRLPPNDAAISYGQAAVASARFAGRGGGPR